MEAFESPFATLQLIVGDLSHTPGPDWSLVHTREECADWIEKNGIPLRLVLWNEKLPDHEAHRTLSWLCEKRLAGLDPDLEKLPAFRFFSHNPEEREKLKKTWKEFEKNWRSRKRKIPLEKNLKDLHDRLNQVFATLKNAEEILLSKEIGFKEFRDLEATLQESIDILMKTDETYSKLRKNSGQPLDENSVQILEKITTLLLPASGQLERDPDHLSSGVENITSLFSYLFALLTQYENGQGEKDIKMSNILSIQMSFSTLLMYLVSALHSCYHLLSDLTKEMNDGLRLPSFWPAFKRGDLTKWNKSFLDAIGEAHDRHLNKITDRNMKHFDAIDRRRAKAKLYLDDLRNPPDDSWIVVRTYDEFCNYITTGGLPGTISLDHDLGEEKTGYNAVKWMCNWILDLEEKIEKKELPRIWIHSANPVGRENMAAYWENFLREYEGL